MYIIIIITDLYSAFRSEDTEALEKLVYSICTRVNSTLTLRRTTYHLDVPCTTYPEQHNSYRNVIKLQI